MSDCPTPTPNDTNGNGEWKSNVAAVVLGAVSLAMLREGLIPWEAASVGIVMSLYLLLPKRLRLFGDWVLSMAKQAVTIWRSKKE